MLKSANSSKRHDSQCKKLLNWSRKGVHLIKDFIEHWIYNNTIEYSELIIKDALINYKTKMKNDLKVTVKDEKKAYPNLKVIKKWSSSIKRLLFQKVSVFP